MLVLLFFDIFIPQIFFFLVTYNDFHEDRNFLILILVFPDLFDMDSANNKHPIKHFWWIWFTLKWCSDKLRDGVFLESAGSFAWRFRGC